jgi:hypothetical protein
MRTCAATIAHPHQVTAAAGGSRRCAPRDDPLAPAASTTGGIQRSNHNALLLARSACGHPLLLPKTLRCHTPVFHATIIEERHRTPHNTTRESCEAQPSSRSARSAPRGRHTRPSKTRWPALARSARCACCSWWLRPRVSEQGQARASPAPRTASHPRNTHCECQKLIWESSQLRAERLRRISCCAAPRPSIIVYARHCRRSFCLQVSRGTTVAPPAAAGPHRALAARRWRSSPRRCPPAVLLWLSSRPRQWAGPLWPSSRPRAGLRPCRCSHRHAPRPRSSRSSPRSQWAARQ